MARDELFGDRLEPRGIIAAHALKHVVGRGPFLGLERGEPVLDPLTLEDQGRDVLESGLCFLRHARSTAPPSLGPRVGARSARRASRCSSVNVDTRPNARAWKRIRAACSRLSIR